MGKWGKVRYRLNSQTILGEKKGKICKVVLCSYCILTLAQSFTKTLISLFTCGMKGTFPKKGNLEMTQRVSLSPSLTIHTQHLVKSVHGGDFPGGAVVKNPPANAGDTGSSPGPGRSHMPRSN